MIIKRAHKNDSPKISEVCFLSKAYWGYSKEQMERWRDDLTIDPGYIQKNEVFVLVNEDEIIGFYSYFEDKNKSVMLDNVFLLPAFIGKGLGRFLMDDFILRVKNEGYLSIILHADPHATNFYSKYGFNIIGKKQTSIEGRYMPIMELSLS